MKLNFSFKIALLAFFIASGISVQAQFYTLLSPRFVVNTPTLIAGSKVFTASNQGPGALDPTLNWGRAIDSEWLNIPLVKPTDSTGCDSPLTSSTPLTGKFALIYRTTCNFSAKAYHAQQLGAIGVVIVNDVAGQINFTMSPGNDATLVTIPCIIIEKEVGDSLNAAIDLGTLAGPVTVTLTDWGFNYANDLAFANPPALPPYTAIPVTQTDTNGNPTWYRFYNGGVIANTGSAAQSGVVIGTTVNFTPTGGAATLVYNDSIVVSGSFPASDSIAILPSAVVSTAHDWNTAVTGRYDLNYTVKSSALDSFPSDNQTSASMYVTKNTYCNSSYDAVNDVPVANISEKFGSTTVTSYSWGPLFYVANGGYQALTAKMGIDDGDTSKHDLSSLSGEESVILYKWKDTVINDNVIEPNELVFVGLANVNFTTSDSNFTIVTTDTFKNYLAATPTPVYLESNTFYWVAAVVANTRYLMVDNSTSYYTRGVAASLQTTSAENEFWAPLADQGYNVTTAYSLSDLTDTVLMYPFTTKTDSYYPMDSLSIASTKLVPAMSFNVGSTIHTTTTTTVDTTGDTTSHTAVNGLAAPKCSLTVSPNPASDHIDVGINYTVPASSMTMLIINLSGQVVYRENDKNVTTLNKTIPTTGFADGNYNIVVTDGKNTAMSKFTVVR